MIFRSLAITFIRTGVPFGIAMALVFSWLLGSGVFIEIRWESRESRDLIAPGAWQNCPVIW
jgi:hypothetical protein